MKHHCYQHPVHKHTKQWHIKTSAPREGGNHTEPMMVHVFSATIIARSSEREEEEEEEHLFLAVISAEGEGGSCEDARLFHLFLISSCQRF